MRRRSCSIFVALAPFLALISTSWLARADEEGDKAACHGSYANTQRLRRQGALAAARDEAIACSRDACSELVRTDCVKWAEEIAASMPTVVFEVRDAKGAETTSVKVSLDGRPWLAKLEGMARAVDPGEHVFRFEIDGTAPREEEVLIREGEKGRKIYVAFAAAAAPARAPLPHQADPAPPLAPHDDPAGVPGWAWVTGGAGVALLGASVAFGAVAASASSRLHDDCVPTFARCEAVLAGGGSKEDVTDEKNRSLALAVTFGGLGFVAVGAAIVGIATAPTGARAGGSSRVPSAWLVPELSPSSARASFGGRF